MKNLLPFLFMSFLLSGCVHYMPAAVSSTSLGPKEHPVAMVTGESSAYYILGLGPAGDDSLKAAVDDALSQKKSDTLMNVFIDRKELNFPIDFLPLVRIITTTVYGTLIRYDDPWTQKNVMPDDKLLQNLQKIPTVDNERELLRPSPSNTPPPQKPDQKANDSSGL